MHNLRISHKARCARHGHWLARLLAETLSQ